MKNECGKMRKLDNLYEIWISFDGTWTWKVLKKWQAPDKEASNPYARWFCAVQSPFTYGSWEYGDVYVREIKVRCPEGVSGSGVLQGMRRTGWSGS